MTCTALLTSVPPLRVTSLSALSRLIQAFEIEVRAVPFAESQTFRIDNILVVIIAIAQGPATHVFLWDPYFWRQLFTPQNDENVHDILLQGCIDFFSWPCVSDELAARIRRLKGRGGGRNVPKDQSDSAHTYRSLGLAGCSHSFLLALELTAKFACYDVPVLLEGETGTGKELFAGALHYLGPRRGGPFVPVNCGALPDSLVENELFGHVAGAYTDARGPMEGVVPQANGGTLFFDEVHCLSPKGQATLLRFVQDQHYRPLGASAPPRRADVRLVAATNESLWKCVQDGRFREDLFYRLNVGYVRLPPLRERKQDIPMLVDEIVAKLCTRYRTGPRRFDAASMAWLSAQPWIGNVRELENVVSRIFMLSDGALIRIDPRHTPIASPDSSPDTNHEASFKEARARALEAFEGDYVRNMLTVSRGNVTEAARQAGKDRRVFGRLIKKYGIDRMMFAGNEPYSQPTRN